MFSIKPKAPLEDTVAIQTELRQAATDALSRFHPPKPYDMTHFATEHAVAAHKRRVDAQNARVEAAAEAAKLQTDALQASETVQQESLELGAIHRGLQEGLSPAVGGYGHLGTARLKPMNAADAAATHAKMVEHLEDQQESLTIAQLVGLPPRGGTGGTE